MIAFGAVKSATLAWTMGDIGVCMMAWLNIISISLGIKGATFWEEKAAQSNNSDK